MDIIETALLQAEAKGKVAGHLFLRLINFDCFVPQRLEERDAIPKKKKH